MTEKQELAGQLFEITRKIREVYKAEEYDTKSIVVRNWLDAMQVVEERFSKENDSSCSNRQKMLFTLMSTLMYISSSNVSIHDLLTLVKILGNGLECKCEEEKKIVRYRKSMGELFSQWFAISESGMHSLTTSEIDYWTSSPHGRNREKDVRRMILEKIKDFLIDDSAEFLENTVSEEELENEKIDLDFSIIRKSLLEEKSMFRKRYLGFRQYGVMEVRNGRICFDNIENEPFMIMKAPQMQKFLRAYYDMKLFVTYLQDSANVQVSEWGIPDVKPKAPERLYKTYADLTPEMQSWVLNKEIFDDYVVAINERIAPRIAELNNKQYWDVVLFVSKVKGVLLDISREKFTNLLAAVCVNIGDSKTIFYGMKRCDITTSKSVHKYYTYDVNSELRKFGDEILRLMDIP